MTTTPDHFDHAPLVDEADRFARIPANWPPYTHRAAGVTTTLYPFGLIAAPDADTTVDVYGLPTTPDGPRVVVSFGKTNDVALTVDQAHAIMRALPAAIARCEANRPAS